MNSVSELLQFLIPSARIDVKILALNHVLGMTGDDENLAILNELGTDLYKNLLDLMTCDPNEPVVKDSGLALINLTARLESATTLLFDSNCNAVKRLWDLISNKDSVIADPACMIMSNLTIDKICCDRLLQDLDRNDITIESIVRVFCQEGYNTKGAKLHYLGPVLSNLSQLSEVRSRILDKSGNLIQRLLPFTEYPSSTIRRGGIIGALRNCCFDVKYHSWLLGEDIDILPRLLLPLAGPSPEDVDPEEMEKLPVDLQYLDDDKKIEPDPDIRKMILETLTQLCATKEGREFMRSRNCYSILKELHKTEEDRSVKLACENVVDILIKKEDEIKINNYKDIDVPDDMISKLEEMDKNYLED